MQNGIQQISWGAGVARLHNMFPFPSLSKLSSGRDGEGLHGLGAVIGNDAVREISSCHPS